MTESAPPTPRLSSTILLLRDAPGLQVLMVTRHYQIDFAAGAMVFPGGKAAEEDSDEAWRAFTRGDYEANERTARIAAIREAYEETGMLLARRTGGSDALVDREAVLPLQPHRAAVDRGEMSFLGLMRDAGFELALDKLVYFGHWITPEMMPKRFDTHFYIAPAPPSQIAEHDGRETTDSVWIEPQSALKMEADKQATIIFPTRMNLKKLARAETTDAAFKQFSLERVVTVLPVVGETGAGAPCLIIPEEAGYGQTEELLANVKV